MSTGTPTATMPRDDDQTHTQPTHTCPTCGASYFSEDVAAECHMDHLLDRL